MLKDVAEFINSLNGERLFMAICLVLIIFQELRNRQIVKLVGGNIKELCFSVNEVKKAFQNAIERNTRATLLLLSDKGKEVAKAFVDMEENIEKAIAKSEQDNPT